MNKTDRIKELVKILNKASKAYYQDANEIMSNFEYDKLYDELVALEEETGIVLANSPTINVGYEVLSELPKEQHPSPMLSLNKTKSVDELADAVLATMTNELQTIEGVMAQIEGEDVTAGKIAARMRKLVNAGSIVKEEVSVEVDGKKVKRMAYKLAD